MTPTDEPKRFPDLSRVRRVRIDDEGPTPYQARVDRERREMAQAANADREREGAQTE
jgi:hypothetical protein